MRINLIGQRNSSGIGNHFGSFATALASLDYIGSCVHELDFQNPDAIISAAQASTDQDVTISFVGLNIHDLFRGLRIQWVARQVCREICKGGCEPWTDAVVDAGSHLGSRSL